MGKSLEDAGDEGLEVLGAEGGHSEGRGFGGVWGRKGRKEFGDERGEGCKDDRFFEWVERKWEGTECVRDGGDGVLVPIRFGRCTREVREVTGECVVDEVVIPGVVGSCVYVLW